MRWHPIRACGSVISAVWALVIGNLILYFTPTYNYEAERTRCKSLHSSVRSRVDMSNGLAAYHRLRRFLVYLGDCRTSFTKRGRVKCFLELIVHMDKNIICKQDPMHMSTDNPECPEYADRYARSRYVSVPPGTWIKGGYICDPLYVVMRQWLQTEIYISRR